jgi:hypothetical protein
MALRIQVAPGVLAETGPWNYEAITQIVRGVNLLSKHLGVDSTGQITTPTPIASISVTAANGLINVAITDQFPFINPSLARFLTYFVEVASDPQFVHIIHVEYMGPARNKNIQVGNATVYVRGYSQLFGTNSSTPVPFGGSTPTAVTPGGSAPPAPQPFKGTGNTTASGQGFGPGVGNRQNRKLDNT